MRRMTTSKDHERRIGASAAKVDEVEACHSKSIYEMKRMLVANQRGMWMIFEHLGLPRITDEQVDEFLDVE